MKFVTLVWTMLVPLASAGTKTTPKPTPAPTTPPPTDPPCTDCDCYDGQQACESNSCAWEALDGACHHPAPGPGEKGGYCNVKYTSVNGREKYTKPTGSEAVSCLTDPECGPMTCFPDDPGTAVDSGTLIGGKCECEQCHGKADPETGLNDLDPTNEATIRVTICHRTCSTVNPWVRITIDDDAWNGTAASGCGHQIHNVTHECWNQGAPDFIPWGSHRQDYLIFWHGTRDYVRRLHGWDTPTCNNGGNCQFSQAEKDYWFYWERACPYVRNGACCGTEKLGPCCGDNPYLTSPPTPAPEPLPEAATACPIVMDVSQFFSTCPGFQAVEMIKVTVGDANPPIADPRDMIYALEPLGDGTVNFKVDNPLEIAVNIYVQHNTLAPGQTNGAFDSSCTKMIQEPGCNPDASVIRAACITPEGGDAFTIVSVYIVGKDTSLLGTGSGAIVEECCIDPDINPIEPDDIVIEYTFEIHCECPTQVRHLRSNSHVFSPEEALAFWEQQKSNC